jgi:diguanylate cyclase (GGDEF)-like protein/PAS domain S-box-containing protein/putative nucleotidyltransferase with HDIG domain
LEIRTESIGLGEGKMEQDLEFNIEAFSGGCAILKRVSENRNSVNELELIDMNTGFEKITGLAKRDVIGKTISDVFRLNQITFNGCGSLDDIFKGNDLDLEYYSSFLEKWFKIFINSIGNNLYIIQFIDITEDKKKINETERELSIYKNAISGSNVGIWEWNVQTGEQTINERWAEIAGYKIDELTPISIETWRKLLHPKDLESANRRIAETFYKSEGHYVLYFRMKHKQGHWVWIESNGAVNSWTPDGKPLIVSGSHIDITKRKRAEDAVRDNERRLKSTQEIAHIGSWEIDLKTKEIWASEEAFRIYGINRATTRLDLSLVQAMVKREYRNTLDEALANLISRNENYDLEFEIINGFSKREVAVRSKAILQLDEGEPVRVIGTIQDITEEKKRQEELKYLGYHDQLTGLYNRRFFNDEIHKIDTYDNLPLTIIECDVDGLKMVNDAFGHYLGDALLQRIADILLAACKEKGIVSRYGGDEFIVILPKSCMEDGEIIIKEMKDVLSNEKIGAFEVSASFGIATKYDSKEDIHLILKLAEDSMYNNKLYESKSVRSRSVDLIMNTLYEKNNREMLHSKRVSSLCEAFALYMKMGKDQVKKLRTAGLLHDIGKIGIDDNILNKREHLLESEWNDIKRHSEIGYRILSSVNEFSEIAESVLQHQEKWNGTGYPKGLKATEISTEARIIAIADAYDAMTGVRPYGSVLSKEEALQEIHRCEGTHFDPQLAERFIDMVKSG